MLKESRKLETQQEVQLWFTWRMRSTDYSKCGSTKIDFSGDKANGRT
jgi:hypothetical protein